jgi:hypothetical protein
MQKADMIAALANVGADLRCVSCGHDQWRTVVESWDEANLKLHAIADDGISQMGIDLQCAVLVCCRCGFVRLHSPQRLHQAERLVDTSVNPAFRERH